jgi:ATP/maltotriose-dependent transcriptional regulator MalT
VLYWALSWTGITARYTGDAELALERTREAVELADRMGGAHARARSRLLRGQALVVAERWDEAAPELERSIQLAREERAGLEMVPWSLAILAEAQLAVGDAKRARETAEQAVALAGEGGTRPIETIAHVSLARVLLKTEGADGQAAIESSLNRALALVDETGARAEEPFIRRELAELARLTGDETACERELAEARRLFEDMGADALAAGLARAFPR